MKEDNDQLRHPEPEPETAEDVWRRINEDPVRKEAGRTYAWVLYGEADPAGEAEKE